MPVRDIPGCPIQGQFRAGVRLSVPVIRSLCSPVMKSTHQQPIQPQPDNRPSFSVATLWDQARASGKAISYRGLKTAFTLYYCLQDSDTPAWARAAITAALAYLILPVDAIPDVIPAAGYTDDAVVLAAALCTTAAHIKPNHQRRATDQIQSLFS